MGMREPGPASSAVVLGSTDCWVMMPDSQGSQGHPRWRLVMRDLG